MDFDSWLTLPIKPLDMHSQQTAANRQLQLTKPPGSLGMLETVAVSLAGMQAKALPAIEQVHITVYAGDHGIMAEGVSAFPQSVTSAMVRNFANGGAAISVLAKQLDAQLNVINLGTVDELETINGVTDLRIAAGTANFRYQSAMTTEQTRQAMLAGADNVKTCLDIKADLYIAGEMGIGNTTSATALATCLLDCLPAELVGPGTGLDSQGISHKLRVIEDALIEHSTAIDSSLTALRFFGGFEIAAMVGSYLACAKSGLPVLIDGFISSVAALAAERIQPGCKQWFLYAHQSAEPGHGRILSALNAEPMLKMNLRLGEGSGAAVAVPLLKLACSLHRNMATFEQANIAKGLD